MQDAIVIVPELQYNVSRNNERVKSHFKKALFFEYIFS